MLWTIAVVLVVLWALGHFVATRDLDSPAPGLAVAAVIYNLVVSRGRSAV